MREAHVSKPPDSRWFWAVVECARSAFIETTIGVELCGGFDTPFGLLNHRTAMRWLSDAKHRTETTVIQKLESLLSYYTLHHNYGC